MQTTTRSLIAEGLFLRLGSTVKILLSSSSSKNRSRNLEHNDEGMTYRLDLSLEWSFVLCYVMQVNEDS